MTILNTGKTFTRSLIAAVVVSAISLPVVAAKYRGSASYDNATYDYARVVTVDPVIERYQVNHPVEQCWDERVPTYSPKHSHRSKSRTPEVVGAIIGGVIGNQIGKNGGGRSRDIATVAGAVLGGSIGRDVKHNSRRYNDRHSDRYDRAGYKVVQHCELKDSYVTKEKVVAYDVAYKYRGEVFYTQLDQHPGEKIKVKITVNPV